MSRYRRLAWTALICCCLLTACSETAHVRPELSHLESSAFHCPSDDALGLAKSGWRLLRELEMSPSEHTTASLEVNEDHKTRLTMGFWVAPVGGQVRVIRKENMFYTVFEYQVDDDNGDDNGDESENSASRIVWVHHIKREKDIYVCREWLRGDMDVATTWLTQIYQENVLKLAREFLIEAR